MKHKYDAETARDLKQVMRTFSGIKQLAATIKKSPTDGSGKFTAIVSTYGPPPDHDGDIITPGAYRKTIMDAMVRHPGALWPVYWMHKYDSPENAVGIIINAAETSRGLVVEGRLSLDNPKAMAVYEGMLQGAIRDWSIGFGVVDAHKDLWTDPETGDKFEVQYLDELELLEISSVMAGSNRFTETLAVKSKAPHQGGTVIMDESDFDLPEGADLIGHGWHVEERGDVFAVVEEENGTVVSEHATVEGARARLRDLYYEVIGEYRRLHPKAVDSEIKSLNDRLDAIENSQRPRDADAVDAFVQETRELMVEESLEKARQATWEERMRINMVLDPVPVRVDARMRPDLTDTCHIEDIS